jgi:competence protein ComGF
MNKFKWENEDYSYIKKIEEIPESRKANAQVQEKYLYDVTNFKTRHRKLLRKISKRLDV